MTKILDFLAFIWQKISTKRFLIIATSVVVVAAIIVLAVVLLGKTPKDEEGTEIPDRLVINDSGQTLYRVGDEFISPTVTLIRASGDVTNVSSSEHLSVSGYDMQKVGSYTVHVSYDDGEVKASADYTVEVRSSVVTDITVACKQKKLVWGEKLDREKLTVKAIFDDGHKETVDDYLIFYNNKPAEYGEVEVKVTYADLEKTFTVEVVGVEVDVTYKALEDEAKRILIALGVEDPVSPRDYTLNFNLERKAKIVLKGNLEKGLVETEQVLAYLYGLLPGYTTNGEIVDSIEIVLPSKKIVFVNEELQLQTSVFLILASDQMVCTFFVEELPSEQ